MCIYIYEIYEIYISYIYLHNKKCWGKKRGFLPNKVKTLKGFKKKKNKP